MTRQDVCPVSVVPSCIYLALGATRVGDDAVHFGSQRRFETDKAVLDHHAPDAKAKRRQGGSSCVLSRDDVSMESNRIDQPGKMCASTRAGIRGKAAGATVDTDQEHQQNERPQEQE